MAGLMDMWQKAQDEREKGLMTHPKSASAMPMGDIVDRAGVLPLGTDEYGRLGFALPQAGVEAREAVTLPSRVMEGYQPTMEDIANMALTVGAGGLMGTAPKGALRSGLMRGYHGSPHTFDEFRSTRTKRGRVEPAYLAMADEGGAGKSYAKSYAGKDGKVYDVEFPSEGVLDARKPDDLAKMEAALDAYWGTPEGGKAFLARKTKEAGDLPGWGDDRLFDALDEAGYKGVMLRERPGVDSVAIFDNSIMSILGEN